MNVNDVILASNLAAALMRSLSHPCGAGPTGWWNRDATGRPSPATTPEVLLVIGALETTYCAPAWKTKRDAAAVE